MTLRSCVLGTVVGCIALPAVAQEFSSDTIFLDKILVTAGREESKISNVAQSVIVIEREEIEELLVGTNDPADIIARLVPGYAPSNQTVSGASESFRGRSVLIMVDGVPRSIPLRNNSRVLSMIDMDSIERVEVVNGPSSLYGAGATGGTINFITKRGSGDKPQWSLRTTAKAYTADLGNSITPSVNVNVGGATGAFDYFFSASGDFSRQVFDGKGNEMASDAMLGQGGADRTSQGNLFGTVGYTAGARRFEASVDWTYLEQNPDWLTDYSTTPVSPDFSAPYVGEPLKEDSRYFTAKFTDADFALGNLELKAYYNDVLKQATFTTLSAANSIVYYSGIPGSPTSPFNQSVLESDRAGLNMTVNSQMDMLREGSTLTWGADYTFDHTEQKLVSGEDIISPMTQNQISAFAQLEVPVTDRIRVIGGARFDQFFLKVDDFFRPAAVQAPSTVYPGITVLGGSFNYNALTFNLGSVLDVTEELQAFANFSQGFSLTDIGAFTRRAGVNSTAELCDAYGTSYNPACGNAPDLTISYADIAPDPQIVHTVEGGLRGDWGRVRGTVSAFYSYSENGVNYDVDTNRVKQQKERIWGAELSGQVDATEKLTIGAALGYTDGQTDSSGDGEYDSYLPNNRIASTFKGSLSGKYLLAYGFTGHAEVEFFSGRARITKQKLDGTALLNLALTKDFDNGGKFGVSVNNVFDTQYDNPTASATRGVPIAGLGRAVGLSYKVTF